MFTPFSKYEKLCAGHSSGYKSYSVCSISLICITYMYVNISTVTYFVHALCLPSFICKLQTLLQWIRITCMVASGSLFNGPLAFESGFCNLFCWMLWIRGVTKFIVKFFLCLRKCLMKDSVVRRLVRLFDKERDNGQDEAWSLQEHVDFVNDDLMHTINEKFVFLNFCSFFRISQHSTNCAA